MNRARNQGATLGRRANTTAASTGPPNKAPKRTVFPPIAFGNNQSAVAASR